MRPRQEEWEAAQAWERNWWLTYQNLHQFEMQKSDAVARWLGIRDMPSTSVVDVGCGPFSLLQRFAVSVGCAVDPIDYGPLEQGYVTTGIRRLICRGEELTTHLAGQQFDEAWIYNCLQHVEDPVEILRQAMQVAHKVRLFEWINIPPYQGHLHMLTEELLAQPFAAADWHTDFRLIGYADFDGLNGDFYAGVFRRK